MLKNKAQIARESINITLEHPGPLKVPRNPTNFAFICTQVGLILDIFLFFVCKKHYFEK